MLDLSHSGTQLLETAAGQTELIVDVPAGAPCGMALVGHPQPLLGGHAMHKLPQFLARGLCDAGWLVVRPNFRGVGRSSGTHDAGLGEADDVLALHDLLQGERTGLRMTLVGFSFGAFVMARVARALADRSRPAWRVCLAGLPFGEAGGRHYDTPSGFADALVVHGEQDERVPLAAVLDWARPQVQPVMVVPGADHFFTGKLHVLRALVLSHLKP
ncbi:MAG: hypothetical protein QM740_16525 [Acidovorax sp.]